VGSIENGECRFPAIVNEAWEDIASSGQQLRNKYTFTVYTKAEIDTKMNGLDTKFQQSLDHNRQVLDDTKRAILLAIDKLPIDLPTNAEFYNQIRERLKTDIAAELKRAGEGEVEPERLFPTQYP
jgi:hypothetical protein